jgi:hypothetical protein
MSCSPLVFKDFVSNCQDSITVYTVLEPLTEYKWVITDKFNKSYSNQAFTDSDGHFEIPTNELPAGLLNSYGGEFKLEVFAIEGLYGETQCQQIKIPIAKYYDSIHFEVRGGTNEKSNLGCAI